MYKCKSVINFKDARKTVKKIGYGTTLYEAMEDASGVYSIGKEVHSITFLASQEDGNENND